MNGLNYQRIFQKHPNIFNNTIWRRTTQKYVNLYLVMVD